MTTHRQRPGPKPAGYQIVTFKLTATQRATLGAIAKQQGVKPAVAIRRAIELMANTLKINIDELPETH